MTYRAPVSRILLAMQSAGTLNAPHYGDLSVDDVQAIVTEAGRFAADRIAVEVPSAIQAASAALSCASLVTNAKWD